MTLFTVVFSIMQQCYLVIKIVWRSVAEKNWSATPIFLFGFFVIFLLEELEVILESFMKIC